MRQFALGLSVAALALLASCSGGTQSPASTAVPTQLPTTQSTAGLGAPMINGDLVQTASAMYRLQIDPATLSATLTLAESRAAQKNDDIYDLSVDAFFGAGTIEISGINGSPTSVDVSFTVKHPFNAPTNLAGPATAGNRADLGVSTRLLFVAEAPGSAPTYFAGAGDVIANTDLMPGADGIMDPGGMITDPGTTATAFPFVAVIDELADNRVGISNGSNVAGNFDPTNGWTQASMGAGNNGWTGFGVLHQGQSAVVDTSFDIAALGALGGFQLNVIPIVKYNDPRMGLNAATKRANRLPPATPDATKFGYRMPHGAMDLENVRFQGETGGLIANVITASDINFYVVDWDARATETTEASLADDLTLGNVAIGEAGAPTFEVEIPGIIGAAATLTLTDDDSALGGDAGVDSGVPGDALYYTTTITNTGSGQNINGEEVVGLAKVTDIEAGATFNDTWRFALDPTLAPLAADIPEPIVYQAFTVELAPNNLPPTLGSAVAPATAGNGGTIAVTVTGLSDPENDTLDLEVDWDNDGTFTAAGTFTFPYTTPINVTSPITYTYGGGVDTRTLPVRIKDTFSTVTWSPAITFNVVPCAADNFSSTAFPNQGWNQTNSGYNPPAAADAIATNNVRPGDAALLRFGITSATRGVLYQQLKKTGSVTPLSEIYRVSPSSVAQITSFGANIQNRHIHQMEVDSTGRVLFAMKATDMTDYSPISTVYAAGTGATTGISYFGYTGAAVPWASVSNFSTGSNRVIAMALDEFDNVHVVDEFNVMHKYLKASAYAEDLTGGYPIDLKAAPLSLTLTGSGAGDRKIHDFIIDFRTGSYFFLVQTQEPAGAPGNGYVYRYDCDGYHPTVNGNPNPYQYQINTSTTQNVAADIWADQHNFSGGNLWPASTAGSTQIMITSSNTTGGQNDLRVLNTNLQLMNGIDPTFGTVRGCVMPDGYYVHSNPGSATNWAAHPAPFGWQ